MWEHAFRYVVVIPVIVRLVLMAYYRNNASPSYTLRRQWRFRRADVILLMNLWTGIAFVFWGLSFLTLPLHSSF